MEVNSRQLLSSAAVIRIFESIGLISKEMPSIKEEAFRYSDNVWVGKIPLPADDNFVLIVYVELSNIKYAAVTMCSDNKPSIWYYVICGDETCENVEMNKIVLTCDVNKVDHNNNVSLAHRIVSEISCYDLCNLLQGFESLRKYMVGVSQVKVEDDIVKQVLEFSKTLTIEEDK